MTLKSELERQGAWLFRWRSYLPLVCVPAVAVVVAGMHWPFGSYRFHEFWEWLCLAISMVGLAVRAATVGHAPPGTSGRNTSNQVAWSLNTTGMYSVVRHPLYLGNYLIGLGAVLVPFVWWLPLLYSSAFWLYYERIMIAEEAYLDSQFGEQFEQWAEATPAFIPRFSQWRPAIEPLSLRYVLRNEYTGLAVVTLLHGGIEFSEHLVIEHRMKWEPAWEFFIGAGLSAYVLLRLLKRHTQLLSVASRTPEAAFASASKERVSTDMCGRTDNEGGYSRT